MNQPARKEITANTGLHNETHGFAATAKAHYMLMFSPMTSRWIAWVTCRDNINELEYSAHLRVEDANTRLCDVYMQIEKRPLQ